MTDNATASAVPPKVDPETLAIRARPRRAIRFRRGVIVGISAAGSVSMIAVTWTALKPAVFRHAAQEEELSRPSPPAADILKGLPASYGDVPRLGPPLPGDLGRPILERQRQIAAETQASVPAVDPAAQTAAAGRASRLSERKTARESGLLVSRSPGEAPDSGQSSAAPAAAAPASAAAGAVAPEPVNDPGAPGRKREFVAAPDPGGDINPHSPAMAPSPFVLTAGSVIPASLLTGLRSDLPGLVIAQVTERVYDSPTGRTLLIPQGARLIGTYDSVVAFGQKRARIVWQRIVMPDGSSLRIDNVPATDPSGYAGLGDKVDMHTWQLVRGVALSTLLGVGSELAFPGDGDLVEALRRSTQDNVSRAGNEITRRNLDVQPTVTIRPGAPVRLLVNKDLVFAPWRDGGY